VHSCFMWDSSYDLLMLWLCVGLCGCDVLFSCSFLFFPWAALMWRICCLHELLYTAFILREWRHEYDDELSTVLYWNVG
jgi:hypothetical protein